MNQRWRERRDSYRPVGETIRTADYSVELIEELDAKAFVIRHHYSGTYPAARVRFGLFRGSQLAGVAVLSQPCHDKVLTNVFLGVPTSDAAELGRFVLLDKVPGNGETWFLGRIFAVLRREGFAGVVSFSDPEPRTDADGQIVFPGHIGGIYQAHNAAYLGRATARSLHLLPDGKVLSARALQKLRSGEKGWSYAVDLLMKHGATAPDAEPQTEFFREWLRRAIASTTRRMRHPGNHRYAWGLTRAVRKQLSGGQYPKRLEVAA